MILNGYKSHLTYKFYKYVQKHKIELFILLPHSIYFIQPLNTSYFQLYKYFHSKRIDEIIQTRILKFSKFNFLASLITICVKTFKEFIIFLVFKKTGLILDNLEIVF